MCRLVVYADDGDLQSIPRYFSIAAAAFSPGISVSADTVEGEYFPDNSPKVEKLYYKYDTETKSLSY